MTSNVFRMIWLAGALALAAPAAAEELSLPLVNGGAFDLKAHGQVTVVHYWATWCPTCREEIPVLNAFHRRHGGVRMISVSTDVGRDRDKVERMAGGISFSVGMARDASANSLGTPRALPVTYVLDASGEVRAELRPVNGPLTEQELESAVAPLLGR